MCLQGIELKLRCECYRETLHHEREDRQIELPKDEMEALVGFGLPGPEPR